MNGKLLANVNKIRAGKLLSVQFNLTNACFNKCKYCRKYTWPKAELDFDRVTDVLKYLKDQGLISVCFSGGDPIAYKMLPDLLEYCAELGLYSSIITTLITRDANVLNSIAHYCYKVSVSIDAVNAEQYENCRGVKVDMDLIKNNIVHINEIRKKCGMRPICFSSTISKLNYKDTIDIFNFAEQTGSHVDYYFMHDYNDYQMTEDEIELFYSDMKYVLGNDANHISNAHKILADKLNNNVNNVHCHICFIPQIHALINADGDIYPCCKLLDDNGEYKDQQMHAYGNIYNNDLATEFAHRFDIAYDILEYCKGCWGRYSGIIDDVHDIIVGTNKPLFI